jgi:hypothetical protein
MTKIDYLRIPEFDKDFAKLLKRFRTLEEYFEMMKKAAIELYHLMNIETISVKKIQGFCSDEYLSMKVVKMASRSLKGRGVKSGLRVIYVFEKAKNKITFIEIYFKSDQENEDKERLKTFLSRKFG